MTRSFLLALLFTLSLAFSATASAQGFDYNYLQLNYGNIEFDDTSIDGDGFGISGSFAINPDWHVFAGYDAYGLDFGIDANTLAIGGGYNTELTPKLDAYARLSYQYIELDGGGGNSIDENGIGFGVGVRFEPADRIELTAELDYVDLGDAGDGVGLSVAGLYAFTDAFSLGLGAGWSDDSNNYTLSGRFYFGK